ncbi:MAG: LysR family transcriptional regulator [Litorivicinus sp.]
MFSTRQLNAFIAVAQHQSFQRAADQLSLTSAAISLTIKQMEQEAATQLFKRTTRAVELTDAGLQFLPYAKAAQQSHQGAAQALKDLAQGRLGRLRVALAPSAARMLAPGMVQAVLQQAPDARIQLREGTAQQVFSWVEQGQVELGLQGDIAGFDSLQRKPALLDPFVSMGSGPRIGLTQDTAIEQALLAGGWAQPQIRASSPEAAIALQREIGGLLILPQLSAGPGVHPRLRGLNRQLVWVYPKNAQLGALARVFMAGLPASV